MATIFNALLQRLKTDERILEDALAHNDPIASMVMETVATDRAYIAAFNVVGDNNADAELRRRIAQDTFEGELAKVKARHAHDLAEDEDVEALIEASRKVRERYARLEGLPGAPGNRAPAQMTAGSRFKYSENRLSGLKAVMKDLEEGKRPRDGLMVQ